MVDAGAAYAEVQHRMSELVASLTPEQLSRPVPACPDWTIHDLVAHHAAVVADLAAGNLRELKDLSRLLNQHDDPEVARDRDEMTARQVAERRGTPVAAILEDWSAATGRIVSMIRGEVRFPEHVGPIAGVIVVNDVVVHEGDLREALGLDPASEVLATSLAMAGYGFNLDARIRKAGLPALAFAYDGKHRVFGDGEPAATLTADRPTLVRALASRLTNAQILDLDWVGDPSPYLDLIPEYGPANPA